MNSPKHSIAIIGAGMAGLSCASALSAAGHTVTLFDKGRGPGGRMATRRAEVDGLTIRFDHGTQYFKALDPAFASECEKWREAGSVSEWPAAGKHALVGTPNMNGVIRHLAGGLDVHWAARIERIERGETDQQWTLTHAEGSQPFDAVVCAVPAEQAAVLLGDVAPEFAKAASVVQSAPCWAAMAVFEYHLELPDCIKGEGAAAISWAARNSAKPGREGAEAWAIHASAGFSREILDLPKEDAAKRILAEFFAQTNQSATTPTYLDAHRWLYAFPESADGDGLLWGASQSIGVCGDWLTAPNVEGAWLSGQYLAAAILNSGQ